MTAPVVVLSLVERTLNRLTAATRQSKGNVLTRQAEEAAILRAAFEEEYRRGYQDGYDQPR